MLNELELRFIEQIAKNDEQKQALIKAKIKVNEQCQKEMNKKEHKQDRRARAFLKKIKK